MTTAPTPIIYQDPEGGIFNGHPGDGTTWTNPDYHDYNAITTHYCSSDSWVGNSTMRDNEVGYHFMGYHNVFGTFEEALLQFGLETATEISITGFSAGCFGILMMSDQIFEWFEENVPNET